MLFRSIGGIRVDLWSLDRTAGVSEMTPDLCEIRGHRFAGQGACVAELYWAGAVGAAGAAGAGSTDG